MSLKITVKCVCCGYKKEVGEEQKEMPMCDKCFSPMIAEKVKYNCVSCKPFEKKHWGDGFTPSNT